MRSLIFTILLAILALTLNQTSYLVSVVLVFILCYLAGTSLRGENEQQSLDLMFLAWFLSYLIFHSILPIKVDRYFITMAPALVYFLILGFDELLNIIRARKPGFNGKWIGLTLVLILLTSTTITYAGHTPQKVFVVYLEDAGVWITQQDPQYQDRIIASDYSTALSWYLKKDVQALFHACIVDLEILPVTSTPRGWITTWTASATPNQTCQATGRWPASDGNHLPQNMNTYT